MLVMFNPMSASRLGNAFSALSDSTRRAILASLATGEKTVLELCRPFAVSQPAISRHLRVLEESGLITRRIDGTKRPCRLAPDAMKDVEQWLDMFRRALEANYERLDALLAENSPKPTTPKKEKK
jgi:DNA-binding transcriptional ArsR family regulator